MRADATRRAILGAALLLPGSALAVMPARKKPEQAATAQSKPQAPDPASRLAALEKRSTGRLGVSVLDLGSGASFGHRADERFPMCSTFKLLLAAAILARADRGDETLDRRIQYNSRDLVTYSPVTKPKADGEGLTVGELCQAAVVVSDNTAANLLLAGIGGPAGLTAWLRQIGDDVTRLDRIEPGLNEAKPGDARDTTTPAAMVATMRRILAGDALSASSRQRLIGWMVECQTGEKRLRAGFPKDWRAGDKTGAGQNGTANDVAIVWPPNRAPFLVACYLTGTEKASADERDAIHREVGALLS